MYPVCAVLPVASLCVLAVPEKLARTSGSTVIVILADLKGLVLNPVYSQRFAVYVTVVPAVC